nr:MAG TPA: hypothetical protein [Caudoviricetes sp.]
MRFSQHYIPPSKKRDNNFLVIPKSNHLFLLF